LAAIARTPSQFVTPSSEGAKRRSLDGVTVLSSFQARPTGRYLKTTDRDQAAFFRDSTSTSTPMMSLSFMIQVLDAVDLDLGARPFFTQSSRLENGSEASLPS
jgi:hypothetical protein